jgi:hypothetical protein
MLIKAKVLQDAAWKDVVSKNKGVKDNGLLKLLGELKKVEDHEHDDAQKLLNDVLKLATQLKKDKAVAGLPAVLKHVTEMLAAAETAQQDVAKARAEHEKAQKAKAEAEKKAAAKKEAIDEGDDQDPETSELLTTKLKPLLKLVARGETMHALIGKTGKQVAVMLSHTPISSARRKILTEQLGGGSTKFFVGHCSLEAGAMTFVLKAEVAGLSKLIKLALLEQTGLRLNKVKCRGEDGDDSDDDGDEAPGESPNAAEQGKVGGEAAKAEEAAAAAKREAERARRNRSRALDDIETELRLLRRSFR